MFDRVLNMPVYLKTWKEKPKTFLRRSFLPKLKWLKKVLYAKRFIEVLLYNGFIILTKPLLLPLNLLQTLEYPSRTFSSTVHRNDWMVNK